MFRWRNSITSILFLPQRFLSTRYLSRKSSFISYVLLLTILLILFVPSWINNINIWLNQDETIEVKYSFHRI